jgi:LemA protein
VGSAAAARVEISKETIMKRTWIPVLIVLGVLVLGGGTCTYNRLVQTSESVDASWSQVQNVLQRRADLIPNLVETVKGYAAHEKEIFTEVANARSRLLAARAPAEAEAANGALSSALGRLLAIAEAYPQLRANENFLRLQDELAGTENRIAVERMRYNQAVQAYNTQIKRFPTNLVARVTGFSHRAYFEASPSAQEVPKVDFGKPVESSGGTTAPPRTY